MKRLVFSRRAALTGLVALPIGLSMGNSESAPYAPGNLAVAKGSDEVDKRQFGAAIRPEQLVDRTSLLAAIKQCDILVPEYHGQWSAVEWRKGDPWFGNYDLIVAFAAAHGMAVRGHSLIWEQLTPEWARAEMLEQRNWATVEKHFANLLPRYRGKIGEWIVVNEMIDTEEGSRGIRRNSFQRAYGNDYVARALETARALDPDATLMINEYGMLNDNPVDEARRVALLKLVEKLKKNNVPLDSVGVQGHLELVKGRIPQKRVARFLQELADTGVTLALTEVDVLEDDLSLPIAERDVRVADAIHELGEVIRDQPAVKSVVTWGLSDRHSWLQEREAKTQEALANTPINSDLLNRGLPYDAEMTPKAMRAALTSVMA